MSKKLLFLSYLILVLSAPSFAYEGQDLFGEYYIMAGEPTIDGVISPGEWDNANWLPLDQLYYGDPPDLSNAKWAAMWSPQTNLIYVVVTGTDTYQVFEDGYWDETAWNKFDHVEVHIDAPNSDVGPYQHLQDPAQHWMSGNDNNGGRWIMLPVECIYPENPLDDQYRPQLATTINGDILTYEFAFKPYESFGWLSGRETKTLQLEADLQVGLDVVMCSKSSATFGMLCENAWDGTEDFDGDGEPDGIVTHTKWNLASRFLDHWLILDLNQAWRPRPANKAVDAPADATLQWNAGKNAAAHNVYFGTSFGEVNDADEFSAGIYRGSQALEDTTYTPAESPLELNKTYYWRIDEVNGTNIWKGNVWTFTTVQPSQHYVAIDDIHYNLSFEYDSDGEQIYCSTRVGCGETWDPNYVSHCGVMAWKENEVNWPIVEMECSLSAGGEDCDCKDGIFASDGICDLTIGQWGATDTNLIVWQSLEPAYDANVIIKPGYEYRITFDSFRWQENYLTFYFYYGNIPGNNSTNPDVNTIAEFDVLVGAEPWETVTYSFITEPDQPYIGQPLGIRFMQKGLGWHWIDNIRLHCGDPAFANYPTPADGAVNVEPDVTLTWIPGIDAASHDVYFGTDETAVENATTISDEYRDNILVNSYSPGPLEFSTTYYWRIDEVNGTNIWKGDVWSFTTTEPPVPYLVVDNFESYSVINEIFDTWIEDWATGAFINLETQIARDGNSMRYSYRNNYYPYYSEAEASTADLQIGPDWTVGSPQILSLWFYGDADNSATINDRMYLALEDSSTNVAVVYYTDVNDIKLEQWQQWNIDLEEFTNAGINLTNVAKISIGFGTYGGSSTPGGQGYVFFDDIGLTSFVTNIPPIADAGPDQTVYAWYDGTAEVTLDGSGSYDPDGYVQTYTWFLGGSEIATGVSPTIYLPVGQHTIELIVNDGQDDSEPDEVVITVIELNTPPVADAGPDQTIYISGDEAEVTLDGSGSYDPDEDELTYSWSIDGQEIATGVSPTVYLPVGEHAIELIVNDGQDDSEPDQVEITVSSTPDIEAELELNPPVLNCNGKNSWFRTALVLPAGFLPEDVDTSTPAVTEPGDVESTRMDVSLNDQGLTVVQIDFKSASLCEALTPPEHGLLELTVIGSLTDGRNFYATDKIKIKQ